MQASDEAMLHLIWKACFGDSDTYIEAFLRFISKEGALYILEEDGQIVSMLSLLPCYYKGTEHAQYMYGVATIPRMQHKGYSSKLMQEVITICKKKGEMVLLVPSRDELIPFYEKQGFAVFGSMFSCKIEEIATSTVEIEKAKACIENLELGEYKRLRDNFLMERNHGVLWESSILKFMLEDLQEQGGEILVVQVDGEAIGLWVMPEEEGLYVIEVTAEGTRAYEAIRLLCMAREKTARYRIQSSTKIGQGKVWTALCSEEIQGEEAKLGYLNLVLDE